MKVSVVVSYCTLFLLFALVGRSDVLAQDFLFKAPRQGGFKFKKNDKFDFSNTQHFSGSGVVAIGFYMALKNTSVRYPKAMAGIMASMVGLLKELEDGYRDGWGNKDVLFNELGILTFLLLSDYAHYTLTFKQIVAGPDDYSVGVRFFRTSDFTPLRASFGFYVEYDNHHETWVGIDSHFALFGRAEGHVGVSLANLRNANELHWRPNFGLGFRIF